MVEFWGGMSGYHFDDTIVAQASAVGAAAEGIVRVSGPASRQIVEGLIEPTEPSLLPLPVRQAVLAALKVPPFFSPVPVRVYYWPEGQSYTGQEMIEIHTVGSLPVLDAIVGHLIASGCRLARPGEFTLRAFLAGKLDLVQAEAVLAVVEADDDRSLDVALRQLAGGLTGPLRQLREQLLELITLLEATLDFPEEEDVLPLPRPELLLRLQHIQTAIAQLEAQISSRGYSQPRSMVAITGAPNVGKSSLFNCLLGREEALVFDLPGTTRDYLVAPWWIGGKQVLLVDSAGIGSALAGSVAGAGGTSETGPLKETEPVPKELACGLSPSGGGPLGSPTSWQLQSEDPPASRRPGAGPDWKAEKLAEQLASEAHIELFCLEACRPPNAWEIQKLATCAQRTLLVITKADLPWHVEVRELVAHWPADRLLVTSSVTGQGLEEVPAAVARALAELSEAPGEVVPSTAVRCRASLKEAKLAVEQALQLAQTNQGEELVAAELRAALEAIGTITGAVYTEDILERIFSRFCIGK
jgi:tRNA modification GTPase